MIREDTKELVRSLIILGAYGTGVYLCARAMYQFDPRLCKFAIGALCLLCANYWNGLRRS